MSLNQTRDRLFLNRPSFTDPAYPGRDFHCWQCAALEGLLATFPDLAGAVEVSRIDWARPRRELVELLGEEHQSMPVLILAEGGFVNVFPQILAALAERHGFPAPHP